MIEHTLKAFDKELDAIERRIAEMGGIAEKMVIDAMDALANADTTLAHQVMATDPRLDALQHEIEDMTVMTIARRPPVAVDLRELIGTIRIAGLERVGDLAKNIAKRTVKLGAEAMWSRAWSAATKPNSASPKIRPTIVILDWILPGVSGLEICRPLRARENTRTLSVIMVTARGEEAEPVRGLSVARTITWSSRSRCRS